MINNLITRRYSGKSKNWCRVPISEISKTHSKSIFLSNANKKLSASSGNIKIFYRSFRSRKDCAQFMYSINKRFRRRFGRHIYFKINNSGRAFDYYCVPRINKELN